MSARWVPQYLQRDHRFTEVPDDAIIFIMPYGVGSVAIDLQAWCWIVDLFESAWTLSEVSQGIGRVRRYGCPKDVVFVTEYHLPGGLNDRELLRILAKAVPEAMATLNREIFGTENGDISTAEIDLGDWVLCNGVATILEDAVLEPGEEPELMEPHEILKNLMLQAKGDLVSIR